MATTICLDFLVFPDNKPLAVPFTLAGFRFAKVSAGMDLFVNESGGGKGLQFPDQGIKIKLPVPSTTVNLVIAQFGVPLKVLLTDVKGTAVASFVLNAKNVYTKKTFTLRKKAAQVVLTGGNNEGILAKICAVI